MPVAIAPVGLTGLNWADGEMLGARAAEKFGIPFTLSTMSICSIEDVAGAVTRPFWFQLYVFRDRGFAASLIDARQGGEVLGAGADARPADPGPAPHGPEERPHRAAAADARHAARRHDQARLGAERACGPAQSFGNLEGQIKNADDLITLSQWIAGQFDPTLSLEGRRVGEEAAGAAS